MSDPHDGPGKPARPEAADLAERLDSALLEATRDLKGYYAREIDAQLARMEDKFERRLADVEAEMRGIGIKLVAVRNEFHQSLRDQTMRLTLAGISALAVAVALVVTAIKFWR